MSPSPVRKAVLGEQRTRRQTRASAVLIENVMNRTDDNLTSKLRSKRRENTNDSLLSSAKRTKSSARKRREVSSSSKQTVEKEISPKTEKVKSRMFKQSLSNEDIANILNNDVPTTSSASSEQTNANVRASKTMSNNNSLNEIINNTFSDTDMVTPKSSPIVVNLSPHRSRKTPKKSPIVSSPKTHTGAPLRLSKTPRKLAIIADSPDNSNKTSPEVSVPNGPEEEIPVQSLNNSLEKKNTPEKKSKKKRSFNPKFTPIRRFSKSPKIVLRLTDSKSKYKTPRSKLSTGKRSLGKDPIVKISPLNTASLLQSQSSLTPTAKKSPVTAKSKDYSKKAVETAAKTFGIKIPSELSTLYAAAILNQPKVILENIPDPVLSEGTPPAKGVTKPKRLLLSTPGAKIRRSLNLTSSPLPVNQTSPKATSSPFHPNLIQSNTSPAGKLRMNDTFNKSGQMLDESQPSLLCNSLLMNSKDNASESFSKKSADEAANDINVAEPEAENAADETYDLLEPKTPNLRNKCRKRSSLQAELTSPTNTEKKTCKVRFANPLFNRSSSAIPSSPLQMKDQRPKSMSHGKHNRLLPPIIVHKLKANDIMKLRQGAGSPSLSSSGHKRPSVMSHFAARKTMLLNKAKRGSLSTAHFESQGKSEKTTSTTPKAEEANCVQFKQETNKNIHPVSPSVARSVARTNNIALLAAKQEMKKRSISLSNVSPSPNRCTRSHQGCSVKKLNLFQISSSSTKKSDVKTPIARKMPNFAQIHQKKFEAMESLVDAKNRIAKRHVSLSTAVKTQPQPKPDRPDHLNRFQTKQGIYNRFGFKLMQHDNTRNAIPKTQTVRPTIKEKNRALLNHIRVNRRFELQMKLRKLNS